MENSPQENTADTADQDIRTAEERRQENLRQMSAIQITRSSWGERLLHGLLAAMEACWFVAIVIGLASLGFFGSHDPVLSLWSPFVVLMGSASLVRYLELHSATSEPQGRQLTGAPLVYVLLVAVLLLTLWSSIYVQTSAFYDPTWLLVMFNDLLLLAPPAYHTIGVVLLLVYLCWRGLRIGRYDVEPESVYRMLRLGMGIILGVVVIQGLAHGRADYSFLLLLLIPLFLSLALITHTLANVVFMRKSNRVQFQGNVRKQERALLFAVGGVCGLLLVIGLTFGTAISPEFLAGVQRTLAPLSTLYDLLAQGIAYAAVLFFMPFEWLLEQFHFRTPPVSLRQPTQPTQAHQSPSNPPPEALAVTVSVLKVVLPILLIALVLFLIWLALRVRRARLRAAERDEEIHESLWSWELFWSQVKAFLLGLLHLLWRRSRPAAQPARAEAPDVLNADPAARNVREIYRALLKLVAGYGYSRRKSETPHEFQRRLVNDRMPQVEPA
ncbi:MAG: DUF4129 domain-containing protein, partial [Ktedonobacteraceae bacterium]|nr:DUF4129 domain-containing protein [Ktedonobacteraceae bacterium]